MIIWQGSTPKNVFKILLDESLISKVRVLYSQDGKLLFRKDFSKEEMDGQKVIVRLTQEETFSFHPGALDIQFRVNTVDGNSIPSDVYKATVRQLLEEEVFE